MMQAQQQYSQEQGQDQEHQTENGEEEDMEVSELILNVIPTKLQNV